MPDVEIKREYHGLEEIAARLRKGIDFARGLIEDELDPLPVKKVGREYWMTEEAFQQWLNNTWKK